MRLEVYVTPIKDHPDTMVRIDMTAWKGEDEALCYEAGYWWTGGDDSPIPWRDIAMSLNANIEPLDAENPGYPWKQVFTGKEPVDKNPLTEMIEGRIAGDESGLW